MVSKNQIKLIQKLQQKKYRFQHQMFIVEGKKSILEFLHSNFNVEQTFVTEYFSDKLPKSKTTITTKEELKKISSLKNPDEGIAIFKIPEEQPIQHKGLILVLDDIRDPGNLGTIIRLCDWFGVQQLVCSEQTTDCYNPKVVQASMGSLSRIKIHYTDLQNFLTNTALPIYATAMNGENVHQTVFQEDFILIMGNEANGISEEIFKLATKKITIPRFGQLQQTESLNVATATAILLNEARREK
ncbi:TrmH family RNA methyltransferase [Capnocytophaga cynodegmi]|uniref:TrmH family RNA methyltransferase n=1 Tax=Capnocytophaga cynodegmi TaxID=28189 RepID=UPI001EE32566|nr:RNA methyltransferase [Capnocytophaga cynodegmi]GJQ06537.1 RNA methyltransferase [Capnocytophaga cynodegmi]